MKMSLLCVAATSAEVLVLTGWTHSNLVVHYHFLPLEAVDPVVSWESTLAVICTVPF